MSSKIIGLMAGLAALLTPSAADAYGAAYHAGYTHVGPNGVYHAGTTTAVGGYGGTAGAAYRGGAGGSAAYHSGYGGTAGAAYRGGAGGSAAYHSGYGGYGYGAGVTTGHVGYATYR